MSEKLIMQEQFLKDALSLNIFNYINRATVQLGLESYVIGGFVRDFCLKRGTAKDIDIVAVGSGIDLALKVSELLPNKPKVQVFKTYGTAMLRYKDVEIEFVGARKESYSENSRNPYVSKGTLQDDQNRRDFTINALALSLNDINYGELLDPFNGIEDLEHKIIKTPLNPDITYSDDPLRMMRAIRFASQLNFKIEQDSLVAISNNAIITLFSVSWHMHLPLFQREKKHFDYINSWLERTLKGFANNLPLKYFNKPQLR